MINSELWLLLIALALLLGWYFGYQVRVNQGAKRFRFHRDYIIGLNYLLNEEPDKAVDVFIKMLEVDAETVETHLALGSLFRRRGELDRAIKIHQNLVEKSDLDKDQRVHALLELGQDYLSAGVLDRAENVFKDAINVDDHPLKSLYALQDIYQQEKDWENAVQVTKQIELVSGQRMHTVIAHYYCELADSFLHKADINAAGKAVKRALGIDKNCVRASLIKGNIELKLQDYKSAVKTLKRVESQDSGLLYEAMPLLLNAYEGLHKEAEFVEYVESLVTAYPHSPIVFSLSDYLRKTKNDAVALQFVTSYVQQCPSFQALALLIELRLSVLDQAVTHNDLEMLYSLMSTLLSNKPPYRCTKCGFSARKMHWQCPSCKSWESMKHQGSVAA